VTRRDGAWLAAAGSAAAFLLVFFLRINAAYGPFTLSVHAGDWTLLWELWRQGQIASGVVTDSLALGAVAAAVPWLALGLLTRRRPRR
jgi:hypothetical protein